ncbi:hypothetical protein [Polyangium jinanense]|uniref:Uncharacterized protein n=1 Tax=Polyangium jinanense TaxID=2829994 RepID=A0A9X3X9D4_9BACT|nr:hypothetical protein [Polyangium jinanense]MDC3959548.1 hypothetical protein [Polyangium jinanense]MDC3986147.1 hypothetical protein [Polyangium jinanense]
MTDDRDTANAIAEGINCIAAFVMALREDPSTTPDPEWVTILHETERALDGILAKEVWTDMVVGEEERDRVRKLRALVSDWVATRKAPDDLQSTAESVLTSFGITV